MKRFRRGPLLLAQGLLAFSLMACSSPLVAQRPTPTLTPEVPAADVAANIASNISTGTVTNTGTNTDANTDTSTETGSDTVTNTATETESTAAETAVTSTPLVTVNVPAASAPAVAPTAALTAPTPTAAPATGAVAQAATVAPLSTTAEVAAPASGPTEGYENLDSPVDLLASYYDAVNRQEYARAYGYWESAPLPFDQFAAGYGDTASVQLIVQPPTRIEGAAGSLYAEIPTFLIAQHHDGSTHSFAGCIVTRKSNLQPPDIPEPDVWHLYQARLSEVSNNASIPAQLAGGCAS